jgi:transcriptional regulator with XRE-family HTH domain
MMNEKVLLQAREIISGFLKARREELQLSQAALAEKTGLGIQTIKRMEDAKFWPGLKQYLIVCEALHLFPAIAELEADDPIAAALRSNWTAKPKALPLADAIKLKQQRHNRDGQQN